MLDVLLVNQNYIGELYTKNVMSLYPPLGLAYLAAYLRDKKVKVDILEANAYRLSDEDTVKAIINSKARMIGFGAVTSTAEIAFRLAKKIKEKDPSKIIILGGAHISFLAEESLRKNPSIDYIVIGEGEKILYNLVKAIKGKKPTNKIKGLAYINKKGKFIQMPDEELIKNLDSLPFPARDLLPIHLYRPGAEFDIGVKGKEYDEIITSRGCPNKCVFCSSSHIWKRIRMRSPANIYEEVRELKEKRGLKHLTFVDDTITLSKSFILELCERLTPLRVKWDCYARVTNLTDEVVRAMKRAGCFGVRIGFESGNDEILKKVKKNTNVKQARSAMKVLKKYDIRTLGFFMIGLPGDTRKTVKDTVDLAIELNPYIASFLITTPLPGTEMFEDFKKKGWVQKEIDWHRMDLHTSELTRTDELSPEEIFKLYKNAKIRFYSRPKYWMHLFAYFIRHPKDFTNYLSRLTKKFLL